MQLYSKGGMLAVSALFGIATFFLLAISVISWVSKAAVGKAQREYAFLHNVDRELNTLGSLVNYAETAQRGFLITGDPSYLEAYRRAATENDIQMRRIEQLLAERTEFSGVLPELYGLIEARETELLDAIEIQRTMDVEAARAAFESDGAQHLTDRIREGIDEIRAEISFQLELAEQNLQSHLNRGAVIMNFVSVAALVSGLVGVAMLLHQLRGRAEAVELQRDRERAERADREKSRFLASMSHEIRTPLNAMLGFTELLDSEVSSAKARKYLHAVRDSGDALVKLINDVLDLSKIESGILELDYEPLNIRDFARTISLLFSQQAKESGLDYEVEVHEDCPSFLTLDSLRFRQILVNLIGNALKFTSAGRVRVFFEAPECSDEECTLRVTVEDTGRGIEESRVEEIFKPFRQARAEDEMLGGTGLGLSISRELAALMGGDLSVTSEKGEGATFVLTLPELAIVDESADSEEAANDSCDFNLLSPSTILVVDDNPFNRELVAGYLDETHHKVSFASNGREALEQISRVDPDVVLMDIRMPVMGGQEARERIKASEGLSGIPVIAVTASSLLRQEKALRKQFDGYLRKPFFRADLFAALSRYIPVVGEDFGEAADEAVSAAAQDSVSCGSAESDPEQLREKLTAIREDRWEGLTSAMALGDVLEVAGDLRDLGEEHACDPLVEYAEQLREHAQNFEQTKLEKALAGFDRLIRSIGAEAA